MPVQSITRKTVREFREALQQLPIRRAGTLQRATLPELVEWSRKHPEARKVAPATVNKLLGEVQAVAVRARDNGQIPDDVPWADPFSNIRLEEPEPEREPWELSELRVLFSSPVFTGGVRPKARVAAWRVCVKSLLTCIARSGATTLAVALRRDVCSIRSPRR
jgi:hypothetical protein